MSNQQNSQNLVNDGAASSQEPRRFQVKRYGRRSANDRQNQDLGEEDYRASNDEDAQPSNNFNAEPGVQVHRGRGGFRRGRGRGRFYHGIPYGNFYQQYSSYPRYPREQGARPFPQANNPGADLSENDGYNYNHFPNDNRQRYGYRRRHDGRNRFNNNQNNENDANNQQQVNDNNQNTKKQSNENGSTTDHQTDGAVTDDQRQDESRKGSSNRHYRKKNDRRKRNKNRNVSQSGAENEENAKPVQPIKVKDDETIVKGVLRQLVYKVARRVTPRNRQNHTDKRKQIDNNNPTTENTQKSNGRRSARGRHGNGYFIEQGYYDPYGITSYYYGSYYGYNNRGYGGRGRKWGGRGRGRFQKQRGSNKENQSQTNIDEDKHLESNSTGDKIPSKTTITEQVNQLSLNDN